MLERLDNVAWHTLAGPHASFAAGAGNVRRYARGFSPIAAFADPARPDFGALARYVDAGEHFYCEGFDDAVPGGWRIEAESTMFKMYWDADIPVVDEAPGVVRLGPEHAAQALELARMTRPGPFGPRTLEMGEFFGCFAGGRLVAMAGERTTAGPYREISGVCTHPDHQGRGYAKRLMQKVILRQLARGEMPFLHVMSANQAAHDFYLRMGFRDYCETVVRVVTPT
jgi:GNAT superfamily N-acetyltransferase